MFCRISFAAFAAVVGIALVRVNAQTPDCARSYTVQPGDTCDGISAAQNASTYQLATVNNATVDPLCDNLQPGEVLCLGLVGQDCDIVHVVQSGDGCDTISAAADITEATLFANNPNVNAACTNIYPGEVLCTAPAA